MRRRKKIFVEGRGILYAAMFLLLFFAAVALGIVGLYLYHRNRVFYTLFQARINRSFYLSAAVFLIFSSVLYTPFSYGISHYFLLSAQGEGRFSAFFFLFARPILLMKAVAVTVARKITMHIWQLMVLLAAALTEVGLFFCFLIWNGEDVFSIGKSPFEAAAEFMLHSPPLIGLSVLLWCIVAAVWLLIYLRYILCKYVLLRYPDASVWQALRVGTLSARGRLGEMLRFYLRYCAFGLLTLLTFGRFAARAEREDHCSFSVYADRLTERGWRLYCSRR